MLLPLDCGVQFSLIVGSSFYLSPDSLPITLCSFYSNRKREHGFLFGIGTWIGCAHAERGLAVPAPLMPIGVYDRAWFQVNLTKAFGHLVSRVFGGGGSLGR